MDFGWHGAKLSKSWWHAGVNRNRDRTAQEILANNTHKTISKQSTMKYLSVSVLSLLMSLAAATSSLRGTTPTNAIEIIVDDYEIVKVGQEGFSFIGKWSPSTSGMDFDGESHWAPYTADNKNIAYFRPRIRKAGQYEIFIWYPDDPNADHAKDMPATIHYGKNGKESSTTKVDLTVNTGEWVSLGAYDLRKGKKGFVELGSKADGNVVADAMKFVLV